MNLNQLRFVLASSKTRSFSQAAEDCGVTQPTLSKGIAQLEDELGGRLFERTTRKVGLTAFGRHVLPLIQGVLDAKDELVKGAAAYLNPDYKLARIGLSPLIDMRLLTTVLSPWKRDHNDVDLIFKECFLDTQIERLQHQGIDIALRPRQSLFADKDDEACCPFYEDDLYFLPRSITPGRETDARPIAISDLSEEMMVLTAEGCGLASVTRDLFAAQDVSMTQYPGVAMSYQMLQDWTEMGIGAALLPLSKISPQNRKRARPLILTSGAPARVTNQAVWKRHADYPEHVRALHDYFKATVPRLAEDFVRETHALGAA